VESNLNLPSSNRLKLNNTKIKSTSFIKKGDLSIKSPLKDIHKTMGKIFAHIRKLFTRIGFIEKKLFDIEKSLVFQSKVNGKINERFIKTEKVNGKINERLIKTEKVIEKIEKTLIGKINERLIKTEKVNEKINERLIKTEKVNEKINERFIKTEKVIKKIQKTLIGKINERFIKTEKVIKKIEKTLIGKINERLIKTEKVIEKIEKTLIGKINERLTKTEKVNEKIEKTLIGKINERLIKTEKVIEKIEKKNEKNKSFGQGEGKSDIEKSLKETNQILVLIQKELMRSSALRSREEKAKSDRAKRSSSRAKLGIEESQLEKSSKNIKSSVGEKAEETVAPVKGMFGRIMDFVGTLALGIAGNAIFGWLKNPENMEKVKGWFSWIKENWGWAVAAIGAIALAPLVGVITTIIGTLSLLAPVLIPIAPLLLKALAIVGGIVLAYKGLEAGFNAVRNATTGGSEYSEAHDVLDQKLRDAGLDLDGKKREGGFLGIGRKEVEMTDAEKKLASDVLAKREQLNSMRDDMRSEIRKKHSDMDKNSGLSGFSSQDEVNKFNENKSAAEKEIRAKYAEKITQIVPLNIEAREKGGPVAAGKPYLVGEGGPELFSPNINGSIVNNMRTEKIYQMISSGRRGRGGINMINFPPITNQLPPPPLPNMSGGGEETEVPDISSTNMADPYRQLSPMLYGITV